MYGLYRVIQILLRRWQSSRPVKVVCHRCKGHGRVVTLTTPHVFATELCSECDGKGRVWYRPTVRQ